MTARSQKSTLLRVCLREVRSRYDAVQLFELGDDFSWYARGKPRALVVQRRRITTGTGDWSGLMSDVGVQISWQAHHFGRGGGLRRALPAAGAVIGDF